MPLTDLALQQQHLQQHFYGASVGSDYVFYKADGARLINLDRAMETMRKRTGIKDLTVHDFRSGYGSWRLQGIRGEKLDIKTVSVRLGHKSVKQTEEAYAFLAEQGVDFKW